MKAIPVYEAKNRFSELIAAVEQGDQVMITRRGVPVARLVAEAALGPNKAARREQIASTLEHLRRIRGRLALEGDIKAIAREGLD